MSTIAETAAVSRPMHLLGRVLSGLVIVFLLFDGAIKLVPWPVVMQTMEKMGYGSSENFARTLGVITIACTVLYSIPPTSILGAILLTGYLGGAMASHVRIGSPLFTHILFGLYLGLMLWGGLWLRDRELARLDALAALICRADNSRIGVCHVESHCHYRRRAGDRDCDRADPRRDQAGYLRRPARGHRQGAAGKDLPVDQRLPSVGNLVAIRAQGSRDEAHLQRAASGNGAVYAWEGDKNVGSGRMEILDASAPSKSSSSSISSRRSRRTTPPNSQCCRRAMTPESAGACMDRRRSWPGSCMCSSTSTKWSARILRPVSPT